MEQSKKTPKADDYVDGLIDEQLRRGIERRMMRDFDRNYRRRRCLILVMEAALVVLTGVVVHLSVSTGAWGAIDGWASRQAAVEAVDQIFLAL